MYTIPKNLLSPGFTNAKTAKNSLESYILYLAPYTQNSKGINLCTGASNACPFLCLFTAGRGKFSSVATARINKANFYVESRSEFLEKLYGELVKINKKAFKKGEKIAIRLNGTSDVDFIGQLNKKYNTDILIQFDNLIFYDYTKILGKIAKYKDQNYHLTFSRSEDSKNEDLLKAHNLGANIAVVFNKVPKSFNIGGTEINVLNGDLSDIIMLYNKGQILGLKAKGKALKDQSNFVIQL
jgi:hypothetical protein